VPTTGQTCDSDGDMVAGTVGLGFVVMEKARTEGDRLAGSWTRYVIVMVLMERCLLARGLMFRVWQKGTVLVKLVATYFDKELAGGLDVIKGGRTWPLPFCRSQPQLSPNAPRIGVMRAPNDVGLAWSQSNCD
jgi:hypothetical protein